MAEDESRHQQEIVDTFADGLDLALFLCDSKGSVLFANERATTVFRYPDPSGRSILAVTLSSDVERLALSALAEDQTVQQEVTFHYPDERTGIVRAWPDRTNLGRVFLSILDVTELRRLERVRRDFVANVSHELRTPITMIRAMAETLQDDRGADPELADRYLGRIVSEVDRLTHVISDLLTLSTAESGTAERRSCDLVEIVRAVLGQFQERFDEKGLELRTKLPERVFVLANPPQITQVLMNLVENALNYTTDGHVLVTVGEEKGFATATVEDTGIGIASDQVSRIFERFYRVDSARARAPGTGLGLSIVKHIVESHGGTVELESDFNRGSKFTIKLPLAKELEPPSH
ncbi:MAG: Adaptive-response sensory-kinase SasA [Fimbriimonadaceae bacterium]|nr:Adaptive-response sensory-kinase SasA [Fimbriimonadaceae bacterium]